MVAKVSLSSNLYGALAYNQDKIDRGKGQILETNRVFVPADGRFSVGECVRDFELSMPPQVTTTRGIVHISLNPHPDDKLTDEQLTDIGREYIERMGFGGQPWMIFKHEDIDREHLHIVTTRVRGDGTLISDRNNFEKSRRITDELECKYGLHPKGERQGKTWQLAPIDPTTGDLKRQVGNVIKSLAMTYRFQSLPSYRALLSLYNVGVEKVEGANNGYRYSGLVYSALDGNGGRLFGTTFIDHNSRTVLNGSALGKDFAANALGERFPDLATESRENKRVILSAPIPTDEASHLTMWPTQDDHEAIVQRELDLNDHSPDNNDSDLAFPDLSPVGDAASSLFSIFTPDAGGQTDNRYVRRIKPPKKKRGRSV